MHPALYKGACLILYAVLGVVITIGVAVSCTPVHKHEVPATLEQAAKEAGKAIDEANALIAACANTIAAGVTDGTLSKPDAQSALDKLKGYAARVDQAKALLGAGKSMESLSQAELLNTLLLALHKELTKARPR